MNKIIFTNKEDINWGKNTQMTEIERVISSNTNSPTDMDIKAMLGEDNNITENHVRDGYNKK